MEYKKRLIDADALKALFDERYDDVFVQEHTRHNKQFWNGLCVGVNWGRNTIANATTVDAEPVVHGHWVKHNFLGHDQFTCSECQTLGSPQWKRCPVCEAKMDGEARNEARNEAKSES